MELVIKGDPKEIAALVWELQERRPETDIGVNSKIETGSFYLDTPLSQITFESL